MKEKVLNYIKENTEKVGKTCQHHKYMKYRVDIANFYTDAEKYGTDSVKNTAKQQPEKAACR